MGIDAGPFCVWEWQEEAGRKGGSWTTYVNLSDCYVNNATHNYQGIKCVPCINKIMLHWGGKNRKKNNRKKGQNVRHQKMGKKTEIKERDKKHYIQQSLEQEDRGKEINKIKRKGQQRKNSSDRSCLSMRGTCNTRKEETATQSEERKHRCCCSKPGGVQVCL